MNTTKYRYQVVKTETFNGRVFEERYAIYDSNTFRQVDTFRSVAAADHRAEVLNARAEAGEVKS